MVGPELQPGLIAKCETKTKKPQKHIYGLKLSICLLAFCVSHHDIETNVSKLSFVFASSKLPRLFSRDISPWQPRNL